MNKKTAALFACLLFFSNLAFADSDNNVSNNIVSNGIGLGGAIAVTISWYRNKSIGWAILHGILSWFYVIYYYFTRDNENR